MAASDMRSPPARPTLHDRLGIFSSSPSLPDLRDLFAAKPKPKSPTLRSGSGAIPIPASAIATFTSASNFLRTAQATGDDSFDVIDDPEPPVAAKKAPAKCARKTTKEPKALKPAKPPKAPAEPKPPKAVKQRKEKVPKRLPKEVIILSSDGITPKPKRHEDVAATEIEAERVENLETGQENEGTPLKAKPWKKFKSPESAVQTESGETEAGTLKTPTKARVHKKKTKPETVSRHFPKVKNSIEPEIPAAEAKRPKATKASTPEPINLEAAVQRRMDWTPVKRDTSLPASSPDPFGTPQNLLPKEATLFHDLSGKYGHRIPGAEADAAVPKPELGQVLGKRKVIEMVSLNSSTKSTEASRDPSPAKAKAAKKKPRTITELATAAYGPQVAAEGQREDSLLEYFSVEGTEQDAFKDAPTTANSKGKASKVTKSRKKLPPKKPVLLSPKAAMRQSAAQDFVFGTASQLACEQSPTFLKDLHSAMKASTIPEEDDSSPKPPGKGLWSISARDEEGELVAVEILDMVNSPALPQDDAILDPWTQLPPEAARTETETADSSVIEICSRPITTAKEGKPSQAPIPKSRLLQTQKLTINAAAALTLKISDNSFPLVSDLVEDEMPPPSNQQQTQEEVRDSPSKATAPAQKSRPKYESFTDAKLAKEVSKFGFKAVKTRTGMIALLDQCWKSKSQALATGATFAASSVLASPKRKPIDSAQDASTPSPLAKKPRGRSKKAAAADAVDVEASEGARTRQDSESLDEVPIVPKKKPRRPRKDALAETVGAAPKKKLGRPRKEAVASALSMPPPPKPKAGPSTPKRKKAANLPVDLDSETEASGSSPEQLFSPGGTGADVAVGEDTEISLNHSPTALQSTVFAYITRAVKSAPRTTDPENPSWHERMLMYDPVILEDLTAWLNSGELTKVGHDDEVSALDVKKWCEMRSICCLWKLKRKGGERKRF